MEYQLIADIEARHLAIFLKNLPGVIGIKIEAQHVDHQGHGSLEYSVNPEIMYT